MVEFVVNSSIVNEVSGSFKIQGLLKVLTTPSSLVRNVHCPLLDHGRWQMLFGIEPNTSKRALVFFLTKSIPNEQLSAEGERLGHYEVASSIWISGSPSFFKANWSQWKPSMNISETCCIGYLTVGSDLPSIKDVVTVKWSVKSLSRDVIHPSPRPMRFKSIMLDLFDDEETSNVSFIISNPRRHAKCEEYIYAHTQILSNRAEYFKTMFQSGFAEGTTVHRGASSQKDDLGAQELLYFDDSDYEDDENIQPKERTRDNVDDLSQTFKRRVVRITDTSYATYRAMLYFLYTGSYKFAPLSSYKVDNPPPARVTRTQYNAAKSRVVGPPDITDVPSSSAKSMYRLCHRLEIPELKLAALEHIKKSLTPENIASEVSSVFTSRFPEIQKIEKEYLRSQWKNVKNTPGFDRFVAELFEDKPIGVGAVWLDIMKNHP